MALVAAVVLGTAAAPAVYADSPSASPKKSPHGSYGTRDPQYDGFVPRCPLRRVVRASRGRADSAG